MSFKYNLLQPIVIRLTEKIGWINKRTEEVGGSRHYYVAHETATGDYVERWYGEHELLPLAADDPRKPPGLSYIDPPASPPGGY